MPNFFIVITIIFGVFSIFQYAFVFIKLYEGEYKTQRDFLIAAIPGRFLFSSVMLVIALKKKFNEIPKNRVNGS